jgi:hypothetical protein
MDKTCVSKRILESIALAELKEMRGCESIVAVGIEYVPCCIEGNWRICSVNFGDAELIQHPAKAVDSITGALRQRYNLMTDS